MVSLGSAAVVAAVALGAPVILTLLRLAVPDVVVQIVLGIVIGPQVLGWAHLDSAVRVLSVLGLALLLFLAGTEVDLARLRGRVLGLTSAAYALSFALAIVVGFGLRTAGLVVSPLLIAVILSATSVGIILPVLQDAGQLETSFGRVVVAGASIAEVVPIVVLSLVFSGHDTAPGARVTLLLAFAAFVVALALSVRGIERVERLSQALLTLQETTAEIRVRAAAALLLTLSALAVRFGLEAILGAFLAGATVRLIDRDERMTHSLFRVKMRAVGFGVFIPFFYIGTGMALDVRRLFSDSTALLHVPVFFAALVVVRGLPALLYRSFAQRRRQVVAAGLLQATSLSIPVVAGAIGVDLHLLRPENYAALVAAGLLSVVAFPLLAVPWLRGPAVGSQAGEGGTSGRGGTGVLAPPAQHVGDLVDTAE